jgi:hypothetical protein
MCPGPLDEGELDGDDCVEDDIGRRYVDERKVVVK